MFKFDEICELIRLVGTSRVAGVEIEHAGSRVRIEGVAQAASPSPAPPAAPAPSQHDTEAASPASADGGGRDPDPAASSDEDGLHFVTSPIVGTFYRAPNPDAEPYVKVGDAVRQGQVLCIVEAMKLMNEIESDISGTVVKVLPDNSDPVEYGQRLFSIRPD